MDERVLTAKQAAERLGVSPTTVITWLREGKLEGYALGKRSHRILARSVDRVFEEATKNGHVVR